MEARRVIGSQRLPPRRDACNGLRRRHKVCHTGRIDEHPRNLMFAFFSNRLGCIGSIAVSLLGTLVLMALSWFLSSY
jgi:hypothetical protein